MFKKMSTPFLAFLQTTGLIIYLVLLSFFFNFVTPNMRNASAQFYAPIVMLLLFVISVVISGLLVLGRAGFLFWEKRYKESYTLVGWTIGWGILYFILLFMVIY